MTGSECSNRRAGFRELAHTADWELEVWAPSFSELLVQAAHGMYRLCGMRLEKSPRYTRHLELSASDNESLLVRWLSELLYFGERENLGFDQFDLHLESLQLSASANGAHIASLGKEIKAVTYHNLKIQQVPDVGWSVRIVFDV